MQVAPDTEACARVAQNLMQSREVDEIYNIACLPSPIHYQQDPVQATKTSVHDAINMHDHRDHWVALTGCASSLARE
jgi:hypothetical protein